MKKIYFRRKKGLDIKDTQAYISIEECCNAQTIKVKVTKFHWRLNKNHVLGVEW